MYVVYELPTLYELYVWGDSVTDAAAALLLMQRHRRCQLDTNTRWRSLAQHKHRTQRRQHTSIPFYVYIVHKNRVRNDPPRARYTILQSHVCSTIYDTYSIHVCVSVHIKCMLRKHLMAAPLDLLLYVYCGPRNTCVRVVTPRRDEN